ncbi:hypothetical protein M9H77_30929 [Catharanthus roseus]|uniref:Uncharacterized protein n=1 Tax=Catharanthus roseus TaxID=4058 RepID=A0ACB9ZYM9_CATRO|nr:hypothetical protein M9H77_30929 [Catharanthus roseus]
MKNTMKAMIMVLILMTDITLVLIVGMIVKKGGENGDHFTFLNSLGAYLERRYFIEFNSIACAIRRVDDYDFNIANSVSCVLGFEDRRSMEKEFGPILEDLSISLYLNPSSLCYKVSLEKLKSLLHYYTFPVSLIGDMRIIAFEGNIFLLMPSMTN